jgi:hypothetical protein
MPSVIELPSRSNFPSFTYLSRYPALLTGQSLRVGRCARVRVRVARVRVRCARVGGTMTGTHE